MTKRKRRHYDANFKVRVVLALFSSLAYTYVTLDFLSSFFPSKEAKFCIFQWDPFFEAGQQGRYGEKLMQLCGIY